MGKGIDMARDLAPEHAQMIDDFKDQLLIVFIKRLGGKISVPVSETDDTGQDMCKMSVVDGVFNFEIVRKN